MACISDRGHHLGQLPWLGAWSGADGKPARRSPNDPGARVLVTHVSAPKRGPMGIRTQSSTGAWTMVTQRRVTAVRCHVDG